MVILVVVVILSVCSAAKPGGLRVYKGKNDTENEFPFIVLFHLKIVKRVTVRVCTGSVIAENWVLTAAHCIMEPDQIRVRYGDFTLRPNKTSLYVKIIKTFAHPTYSVVLESGPAPRDDIGLILVEHIPKKPAKLLALDYKTLFGLPVKFAGFGRTTSLSVTQSSKKEMIKLARTPLQIGEGILVPCHNYKNIGPIVCVAAKCSNKMQTGQQGDSGGPLVYDGRIIGVVKAGGSQQVSLSGAFTPVSIYLQWLKQVMSSHGYQNSIKRRT